MTCNILLNKVIDAIVQQLISETYEHRFDHQKDVCTFGYMLYICDLNVERETHVRGKEITKRVN